MNNQEVILRFDDVFFGHGQNKPILNEVNFTVRRGSKITLMGQNGVGKSTVFHLITGDLSPDSGSISLNPNLTVAIAKQVIPMDQLKLTVREFFQNCFKKKVYDIDPKIEEVLEIVNLEASKDRLIKAFSGGQQAKLLLASAIIQKPDLLLLDEPTNNLDEAGINHLTQFLVDYKKTCIVISHDANFLNTFTEGVLYLDIFARNIEQYTGNYFDLLAEIEARIKRENRKNAQLAKKIIENKEKVNYFAQKGGKMRLVAKKMRDEVKEMEEAKVEVRREDKTIRSFIIPCQEGIGGEILNISSFSIMSKNKFIKRETNISLRKRENLLLMGPNGIGKTTLLESLALGKDSGIKIAPNVTVGYYRQNFSTLNFDDTVYQSFSSIAKDSSETDIRSLAAGFLITNDLLYSKIGSLSEGQKGLVSLVRLVLQKPGLLILDEPTNHINFRHLPVIADALNKYDGAMILVSHMSEFINKIKIDRILDLGK
ncbi:MAG: ABC-F family ATP-binding cassette domain-containing protein [Candidatus Nealsonbacteria bacterium]